MKLGCRRNRPPTVLSGPLSSRECPVAWFISYQHALRLDEAGIKLVCDRMEAYAEKLRLEARGYVITKVTQKKLRVGPLLDTQIRLP
jgi:hypothetical protein